MDQVVHADKPAGSGNVVGVGVPGVEQDGNMVVPVEEDQWLLPQDNEYGISQLRNLAQGEHPVPETSYSVVQETEKKAYQKLVKHSLFPIFVLTFLL